MSDRPNAAWKAEVFADVFNLENNLCTVDEIADDCFEDWSGLYPHHQRPDYLALRIVVRSALRSAGVPEW